MGGGGYYSLFDRQGGIQKQRKVHVQVSEVPRCARHTKELVVSEPSRGTEGAEGTHSKESRAYWGQLWPEGHVGVDWGTWGTGADGALGGKPFWVGEQQARVEGGGMKTWVAGSWENRWPGAALGSGCGPRLEL